MNATQARIHMLFVMPLFNKYMRIVYQQFHNMSQGYFIFNKQTKKIRATHKMKKRYKTI